MAMNVQMMAVAPGRSRRGGEKALGHALHIRVSAG
jgi:hypothetical protein